MTFAFDELQRVLLFGKTAQFGIAGFGFGRLDMFQSQCMNTSRSRRIGVHVAAYSLLGELNFGCHYFAEERVGVMWKMKGWLADEWYSGNAVAPQEIAQ